MADHALVAPEPEVGMDPRSSFASYPRRDKIFTHKKSLDFQSCYAKVFLVQRLDAIDSFVEFVIYAIIGILVGFTCSIVSNIEEKLTLFRRN